LQSDEGVFAFGRLQLMIPTQVHNLTGVWSGAYIIVVAPTVTSHPCKRLGANSIVFAVSVGTLRISVLFGCNTRDSDVNKSRQVSAKGANIPTRTTPQEEVVSQPGLTGEVGITRVSNSSVTLKTRPTVVSVIIASRRFVTNRIVSGFFYVTSSARIIIRLDVFTVLRVDICASLLQFTGRCPTRVFVETAFVVVKNSSGIKNIADCLVH